MSHYCTEWHIKLTKTAVIAEQTKTSLSDVNNWTCLLNISQNMWQRMKNWSQYHNMQLQIGLLNHCSSETEKPSMGIVPTTLASFSSCDLQLWSVVLTKEPDLDWVKVNHHAKYLDQMSFFPKVIVCWHHWLGILKSIQPVTTWVHEYLGAGIVICLQQGANDLHMVQLMPLPPHHLSLY